MMIRRSRRNSTSASLTFSQTLVPISICERNSSDVTCAPQRSSHSAIRLSDGSTTRLRVSLSTSRYSSSIPIVNGGPLLFIALPLLPPFSSGGPRLTVQSDSFSDQVEDPVQCFCDLVDTMIIVDEVLTNFYGGMA